MGHHSHTFQPVEIYKKKYIFYSLGGLCFGDYKKGKAMVALPRKTKKSFIFTINTINEELELENIVPLKELKGNRIKIFKGVNPLYKNKRRHQIMLLSHRYKLVSFMISLKEGFIDRVIEYFFGYYKNPIKELLNVKNILKIPILFEDYFWKRKRKT